MAVSHKIWLFHLGVVLQSKTNVLQKTIYFYSLEDEAIDLQPKPFEAMRAFMIE